MSTKYEFKFKVGDIVREIENPDNFFLIRGIYEEEGGYDAAFCDKDGNLEIGSIDIWLDEDPDEYATEDAFERVER